MLHVKASFCLSKRHVPHKTYFWLRQLRLLCRHVTCALFMWLQKNRFPFLRYCDLKGFVPVALSGCQNYSFIIPLFFSYLWKSQTHSLKSKSGLRRSDQPINCIDFDCSQSFFLSHCVHLLLFQIILEQYRSFSSCILLLFCKARCSDSFKCSR